MSNWPEYYLVTYERNIWGDGSIERLPVLARSARSAVRLIKEAYPYAANIKVGKMESEI